MAEESFVKLPSDALKSLLVQVVTGAIRQQDITWDSGGGCHTDSVWRRQG